MYPKNRVFEPLFGGRLQEVVNEIQKEEKYSENSVKPVSNNTPVITSSKLGNFSDLSKNKLVWLALVILLILVLVYLLKFNKPKKRRNPKKLSRFVKASRRETLE